MGLVDASSAVLAGSGAALVNIDLAVSAFEPRSANTAVPVHTLHTLTARHARKRHALVHVNFTVSARVAVHAMA